MRALITILFIMHMNANTVKAAETQNLSEQSDACEERVSACEAVIQAVNKYIKHLNTQLDQKTDLADTLERELTLIKQRAIDTQPSWYEKPGFVVPATIIATILTVTAVRRAVQD